MQGTARLNLSVAPTRYDGNAIPFGALNYDINTDTYLPGGSGFTMNNSLPVPFANFIYLKVTADLTALGFGSEVAVYVPCYFNEG